MIREADEAQVAVRDAARCLQEATTTRDQCRRSTEEADKQFDEAKAVLLAAEQRLCNALHVEATGKDRERFL